MSLHREQINELIDKAMRDEAEVVLEGFKAGLLAPNPYPPCTQEFDWWETGHGYKHKPCGFVGGTNSCKLAS